MSRFPLWMWLLVTFGTNVAQAQTPGTPVEGQRVRVAHGCEIARDQPIECRERRSLRVETGQFRALDGDTLRMRAQSTDAEVAIPTAYVTQVSLAGALIGGVIGSPLQSSGDGWGWSWTCKSRACGVGLGAEAGFLVGGVV